jgi:threonine dehydratase
MITQELIHEAARRIRGHVRLTPVEESPVLSDLLGVPVWLKLENVQLTGSFKVRGALFSLMKAKESGMLHVATCSAGNHGRGVAWAARELGMTATIFVPSGVDSTKYEGMVRLGADVRKSAFSGYDATELWAKSECARLKMPFISAYDDYNVMAANGGSMAMEVLDQVPDLSALVVPVGGGGMASGAAFYLKNERPECALIACQHEGSPAFLRSVEAGRPVLEMPPIETLASGLEGGFGEKTYGVLKDRFDEIRLVGEPEVVQSMAWMIEHHQWIIEGSAAVTVAACMQSDFPKPKGPIVLVLSGRNVSVSTIRKVLGVQAG